MGLLDSWGSWSQDADKNASINQGLLAMGLNLLNSKGSFGNAIGQAGLAGMDAQRASYVGSQADKMRKQQMEAAQLQIQAQQQAEEQRKRQQAFLQGLPSPWQQAGQQAFEASGKTLAMNGPAPQVDPMQSQLFGAMKAGVIDYPAYLAATRKDTSPVKLGAGEQLLDPKTFRPIATNAKPEDLPSDIRTFQYAQNNPSFDAWNRANKQAGASRTSVTVDTAPKAFWQDVGKGSSDVFFKEREGAQAASSIVQSIGEIRRAVSGGAFQGAGADLKLSAAKALGALGMPYDANTVANTELLNAQANKFVLESIKQLGANPSNADREFIEKTVPRISTDPKALPQLLDYLEDKARGSIRSYNSKANQVQGNHNASGIPFQLTVPEPEPYTDVQSLVDKYRSKK